MNRLLAPEFWVGISSASAVVGIVLAIVGMVADLSWARTIGLVLIAPLLLGAAFIGVVVIPFLIIHERKSRRPRSARLEADDRNSSS